MSGALPPVPPHLRRFVVEQDYAQYSAVDQAVWRFVLLQTHARLLETAHPAYREGLRATGISVERIPSIAEMNEKLSRFGWGAVCVDGFIPPRAFQEFQASRILPIAADMRTSDHLVYTPAPDIIHEAAGHAPILPDPVFAAYVQRIGELGKSAFTLPEENRVYDAIYRLSEVKEDPALGAGEVARAEAELELALRGAPEPSEAAKLSRLYWWTAEYGLVGRLDDYRLYGAGLLSSLWESHACHAPSVRKVPLDESAVEVAYDITQPQPQLFVARDFEALHDVLDRVRRTLAVEIGGRVALERAVESAELATARFASGACVLGRVLCAGPSAGEPAWLEFDGPTGLGFDGKLLDGHGPAFHPEGYVVPCGPLSGGASLARASDRELEACRVPETGRHVVAFASGARVEGRLRRSLRTPDGRLAALEFDQARAELPGTSPRELAAYTLLATGHFVTAEAGAIDPSYHPDSPPSAIRVPRPRAVAGAALALLGLYEKSEHAHRAGPSGLADAFGEVHAALARNFPNEWLLRWNLLESLLKVGDRSALVETLRSELEKLEVTLEHRQPITSGLRYLSRYDAARSARPLRPSEGLRR